MGSTLELLRRQVREGVEFVLVGGMAAVAHGSAEVTEDVDVCVRFDAPTLRGLFRALEGLNPRQRMHPARPLLGDVSGVGGLDRLKEQAIRLRLADFDVAVMGLEDLVTAKRAVARPKDLRVARELERVLAHKGKPAP